jgi:hypothetical protein
LDALTAVTDGSALTEPGLADIGLADPGLDSDTTKEGTATFGAGTSVGAGNTAAGFEETEPLGACILLGATLITQSITLYHLQHTAQKTHTTLTISASCQ